MRFSTAIVLISYLLGSLAFATPSTFSYQGRLFDDNSEPLTSGNAAIVLQILDPTGNCLLFEESHTVLMDNTGGYFRVSVGLGTKNTSTAPNFDLKSVFSNQSTFNDGNLKCGPSYTPSANHHRLMRVTINGETLVPDHTITATPFALQAADSQKIEGKSYADIKNYTDKNFAGSSLPDLQATPLTAGDSFQWDGTKWITTQAAPKDLPSNSVTLDDVDFASSNGIAVPSLNAAPGSPTAGQIYFNSVSNKVFFYNGTTWVDTGASSNGDFRADGSVAMTGNINLGGRYLSGDGGNEGIFVDSDGDVGVGTTSPNTSAAFDISSTTKGFLPPRMTTAQRTGVSSPVEGLVVFDTDENALFVRAGGNWVSLGGSQFAFQVHRNGTNLSLPSSSSYQLIDFTAELEDSDNAYNLATDRFQPTKAGYYWFNLSSRALLPVNDSYYLWIRKNGSIPIATNSITQRNASTTNLPLSISGLVYLNGTTDYVEPLIYQNNGGSMTVTGATGYTKFSGFAISSNSSSGGSDNLGNHTATQNIVLGSNYISNDGDAEGLSVDANGNVGVGTNSPSTRLDIVGQIKVSGGSPGAGKVLTSDATGLATWTTIGASSIADGSITLADTDFGTSNGINIPQLANDPSSPTNGQIYYNTASNKLKVYNGTAWSDVGTTSGSSVTGHLRLSYTGSLARSNLIPFAQSESSGGLTWSTDKFTATKAGIYLISGQANWDGSQSYGYLRMRKNGSYVATAYGNNVHTTSGRNDESGSISLAMNLAVGDDIDFYWTHDGSAATVSDATASITYLGTASGNPVSLVDADNDTQIQIEESSDEDRIRFDTAGTERVIINESGNVGIGHSAPARNLVVQDGTASAFISVRSPNASAAGILLGDTDSDARGQLRYDNNDDSLRVYTAAGERVRIDNSGNIGIGTTSPSEKLEVNGNLKVNGNIEVTGTQTGLTLSCVNRSSSNSAATSKIIDCSSGEIATGGSCYTNSTSSLADCRPRTNGWQCTSSASACQRVHVRCCKIQ